MVFYRWTGGEILFLALGLAALASVPQANMVVEESETSLILLSSNDTDLRSTKAEVISGPARVFSGSKVLNLGSCLCGSNQEEPRSGWCYLGESKNVQRSPVNVSTVESGSQALLRCSLYITVGKTYLYCSSKVLAGESNCQALLSCSSRTIAVVCTDERDCVAWCDSNTTRELSRKEGGEVEGESETTVRVTRRLGDDVIGVIAAGGVLCLLVTICCIVDKVKSSKWWILHFPRKRKMSKLVSEDAIAAVSRFQPPESQPDYSASSDLTLFPDVLETRIGPTTDRKQSKKKLKVQFRSASLPTMLECSESSVTRDQSDHRSNSCGDSAALSLGDKICETKFSTQDNSLSDVDSPPSRIDSTKL